MFRDAEHGARGGVDDLRHARVPAGVEQDARAVDVDRAQQDLVARQRYLGHVVEDDVDAIDGGPHRARVANVAVDVLDRHDRRRTG